MDVCRVLGKRILGRGNKEVDPEAGACLDQGKVKDVGWGALHLSGAL